MKPKNQAAVELGLRSALSKPPAVRKALGMLAVRTRRLKKQARTGAERIKAT